MLEIKICGITNYEDAELAAGNGATALGFNFYPDSPRYIQPDKAARIIERLPNEISKIGVFVNSEIGRIQKYVGISGIEFIQLHGDEDIETVESVAKLTGLGVIKALRVRKNFRPSDVCATGAEAVLLDTYSPAIYGGTGESFNWSLAKESCGLFHKVYLAGGLGPENVAKAIDEVRPFGIDSCSALESHAGRKDPQKLLRFLRSAIEAEQRDEKN